MKELLLLLLFLTFLEWDGIDWLVGFCKEFYFERKGERKGQSVPCKLCSLFHSPVGLRYR